MASKAIQVDFIEAAAPATPATGDVRLYSKTDGLLYSKDDAGTETLVSGGAGGGGGGNPVVYDIERYTGGDITVSSTTVGADLAGVSDVVVAAASGDLVMIGANVRQESGVTPSLRLDVKCITGSTENYVSSLGTTPAAQGISGWLFAAGASGTVASGEVPYVVQAGDISGGNLTLSLRSWVTSSTRTLAADADAPLLFWVRNLGQ
jgi:hypothetical protein